MLFLFIFACAKRRGVGCGGVDVKGGEEQWGRDVEFRQCKHLLFLSLSLSLSLWL
jgi:hypothetical protein